jgi:hypothetical protein
MPESSSDEDLPLSKRPSAQPRIPTQAAAAPHPGQAHVSGNESAGRSRVDPTAPVATEKKRSRGPSSGGPSGGSSARAARLGCGGSFALEAATGDFSASYATIGVLGRGSFTEVNLLRHRESGRLFVLKTCCKLDALSYAHLRAEAAAMHGVDHPLLVAPVAISSPPGRSANYSLLLPLCPGGDLLQLLRRQPGHKLPLDEARSYCCMVVLGLSALHEHGCVCSHGPLPPQPSFQTCRSTRVPSAVCSAKPHRHRTSQVRAPRSEAGQPAASCRRLHRAVRLWLRSQVQRLREGECAHSLRDGDAVHSRHRRLFAVEGGAGAVFSTIRAHERQMCTILLAPGLIGIGVLS